VGVPAVRNTQEQALTDTLLPLDGGSGAGGGRVPPGTERRSFEDFYQATAPHVVRQVHAMTGDLAEAQDCVAEAYARAWQRWSQLSDYDAPDAWVRRVAWRLAARRFRRARVGAGLLRRLGPPDDVPALSPDRVAVVAALRRLPEAQRRVVVLHHLADRSIAEIAAETGTPTGTVKAQLSRRRTGLAAHLSEIGADL